MLNFEGLNIQLCVEKLHLHQINTNFKCQYELINKHVTLTNYQEDIHQVNVCVSQLHINMNCDLPSSTKGGSYHPLKDFFHPTKTLVSAANWLLLIVGLSF